VDYATLKKWECLDSATGEALAAAVSKYHIPRFLELAAPPSPLPAPKPSNFFDTINRIIGAINATVRARILYPG
jgi:hypothetical protein